MSSYKSAWYRGWSQVTNFISGIQWTNLRSKLRGDKPGYNLTEVDHEVIKTMLAGGYYIILTKRDTHLTTYFIEAMSLVKTGRPSDYTHALMNLDLVTDPEASDKFKLMEATSAGVHYSTFMEVFDCDSVCLLQPKNMDPKDWDGVMKGLAAQLGKQYDNLFDINDSSYVSCVEMVLDALRYSPNYKTDFPNLEAMIQKVGNLTPQMYRDCPDFEIKFEIKR